MQGAEDYAAMVVKEKDDFHRTELALDALEQIGLEIADNPSDERRADLQRQIGILYPIAYPHHAELATGQTADNIRRRVQRLTEPKKRTDNPRGKNLGGADTTIEVKQVAPPLTVQRLFQESIKRGEITEPIAVAIMETCIDFLMESGYFEREGAAWLKANLGGSMTVALDPLQTQGDLIA